MKKTTLLGVMVGACLWVSAQQTAITPVTVGDTVFNITFTNLINYPVKTARLSDFKGKLVILDFWATTCPNCIAGFKKVNQLQQQYANQVAFVLVNPVNAGDSLKKILEVIDKKVYQNILYKDRLAVAAEDVTASKLFPYASLPHIVWIKDRQVLAITSADELSDDNIASVLKDSTLAFKFTPKEEKVSFDPTQTLFSENYTQATDQPMLRSTAMGRLYGLNSSASVEYSSDKKNIHRVTLINNRPLDALSRAYPALKTMKPAQIIIDDTAPDFIKRSYTDSTDKINKEVISYELILPPTEANAVLKIVQDDLCRYLNVNVSFEKRNLPCYTLTSSRTKDFSEPKTLKADDNLYDNDDKPKYLHNKPLVYLIRKLNATSEAIFIDETGLSRIPVTIIDLPNNLKDTKQLAEALSRQGFNLKPESKWVECAVIKGAKK